MRTAQAQQQQKPQITSEQIRQEIRSQKESVQAYKDQDTDIEKFLAEVEETGLEESKMEKRRWRMEHCGLFQYFADPHIGCKRHRYIRCNLCDDCKELQGAYMAGRINHACTQHKTIRMIKCGQEEVNELWEKAKGKKNAYKIPQADNQYILFVPGYIVGKKGTAIRSDNLIEVISKEKWIDMANNLPEGRRTSGGLGRRKPVEQDENKVIVEIKNAMFKSRKNGEQPRRSLTDMAWDEATMRTLDLNPKTPDEVVEANNTRVKKYVEVMKKYGYELDQYCKMRIGVNPDNINWKISNSDKILYMNSFRRSRKKTADS